MGGTVGEVSWGLRKARGLAGRVTTCFVELRERIYVSSSVVSGYIYT